jgi:beta-lactamase class A
MRTLPVVRRTVATLLLALLTLPAVAGAAATTAPKPWKPDIKAALKFAHHRHGDISFAVRTDHHLWKYRGGHTVPCASVFKAMALVTYLNHVRGRALNSHDRSLLYPMIHRSSDHATDQVVRYVGLWRVRSLARKVGMRRFSTNRIWGRSRIDANDQSKFLLHIDDFTVERHRAYALKLLAGVTGSQRWGVGQVRPKGWKLYFKGGWGLGTGWVDHQVALLTRRDERVSVVVLTHNDGSHGYGKATLRGLFARLLTGLETAEVVR